MKAKSFDGRFCQTHGSTGTATKSDDNFEPGIWNSIDLEKFFKNCWVLCSDLIFEIKIEIKEEAVDEISPSLSDAECSDFTIKKEEIQRKTEDCGGDSISSDFSDTEELNDLSTDVVRKEQFKLKKVFGWECGLRRASICYWGRNCNFVDKINELRIEKKQIQT